MKHSAINNILNKKLPTKKVFVRKPDGELVDVGDVLVIYLEELDYCKSLQKYTTFDHLVLLDNYDEGMGKFFVDVVNNMYFDLKLNETALIYFYKIHDDYGLPEEVFNCFSLIENHELNAFTILVALAKADFFESDNIIHLRKVVKEWLDQNFVFDIITYESIALPKVRNVLCHVLKTFNFENPEIEVLEDLVKLICELDKQTDSNLSEKCINDLMACIQWHNITNDEKVNNIFETLKTCPNFKMTKTITDGLKKRKNLADAYDKCGHKEFKYRSEFLFRKRFSNVKTFDSSLIGFNSWLMYSSTVIPEVIRFYARIIPNMKFDGMKSIVLRTSDNVTVNMCVKYEFAGKMETDEKLWTFNGNKKLFINLPVEADKIELVFSRIVANDGV
jgi:hypothetical protein